MAKEVKKLEGNNADLEDEVSNLNDEVSELKERLWSTNDLKTENDELKDRLKALSQSVSEKKSDLPIEAKHEIDEAIRESWISLAKAGEDIDKYPTKVEVVADEAPSDLVDKNKALKNHVVNLEAKMELLEEENKLLYSEKE